MKDGEKSIAWAHSDKGHWTRKKKNRGQEVILSTSSCRQKLVKYKVCGQQLEWSEALN